MREITQTEQRKRYTWSKPLSYMMMAIAIGLMSMFPTEAAAQKLTIRIEQGTTLDQAFQKMIKSSHVLLVYNTDEAASIRCSAYSFQKKEVKEILDILLANTPLTYTLKGDVYTIIRRKTPSPPPKEKSEKSVV